MASGWSGHAGHANTGIPLLGQKIDMARLGQEVFDQLGIRLIASVGSGDAMHGMMSQSYKRPGVPFGQTVTTKKILEIEDVQVVTITACPSCAWYQHDSGDFTESEHFCSEIVLFEEDYWFADDAELTAAWAAASYREDPVERDVALRAVEARQKTNARAHGLDAAKLRTLVAIGAAHRPLYVATSLPHRAAKPSR